MNEINLLQINNETICPITLFGRNRSSLVTDYHKRVMSEKFSIPINYIECNFPSVSHGQMMNYVISQTIDSIQPDYYWFLDNDSCILKKRCIDIMYDFVKNKQTIAGQFWQSNHLVGPNGQIPHPYISQAFLWFPTTLFYKLGRHDLDHWVPGCDTAENLTYKAKFGGYAVAGFYPSSSVIKNCDLDNGQKFGMGNIYGENLMCHASQQDNPESEKWFIETCQKVLKNLF